MIPFEYVIFAASILLLLSVIASKASHLLGIPALLLFIFIGMLSGSEGIGGIQFDNAWIAQSLGTVALCYILFSGGLDTNIDDVKPVLLDSMILSTVCVAATAFIVGLFTTLVFKFSWLEGLLLGSIVSSTDAAAVFSILRAKRVNMNKKLKSLLELESGSNDPMAVLLTVGFSLLSINPGHSLQGILLMLVTQIILGLTLGYILGKLTIVIINSLKLEYVGLYPVLTLAIVLVIYSATTLLGGNGFLAVYISGMLLGNSSFVHKNSLTNFHSGIAWLMQITMFIVLGLLVFPSRIIPVIPIGLLLSAFLIFVARPVSVFASLVFSKLNIREKSMISWVGLRGAVPVILATFPLIYNVPNADMIFNLVFFIVITSALLQGSTIPIVAKWLGVLNPKTVNNEDERTLEIEKDKPADIMQNLIELEVSKIPEAAGKQIVQLGLPMEILFVLLKRGNEYIVPTGSTTLQDGDILLILADKKILKQYHM